MKPKRKLTQKQLKYLFANVFKIRKALRSAKTFQEFESPFYKESPILTEEEIREIKAAWGKPRKWKQFLKKHAGFGFEKDYARLGYQLMKEGKVPTQRSIPVKTSARLYRIWQRYQKRKK